MARRLAFTSSATLDIQAASRWYDAEQPGLGRAFQDELWRVLDLLVANPEIGPIAHRDLRRVMTRKFPYVLYYRLKDDIVEVRACLHQRRHPRVAARRA